MDRNYKQEYKKAFEAAKGLHDAGNALTKRQMEIIFPQLAESEDERIRKALIDGVRQIRCKNGVTQEQMLAYLEKQKINTEGDFGRGYDCGYEACLNSHGAEWFEKQKEQKPAQTSEEKEYIHTLKNLISGFIRDKQPEDVAYYQRVYDWLDGRHIEQKPAEWSEEDERILKGIIGKIDHDQTYGVSKVEMLSFLKSIRPSWKPTEERQGVEPLTKLEKAIYDMLVERTNEGTISEKQARKFAPIFLEIAKDEILGGHWKPSEAQMKALLKVVDKARELHYSSNSGYDEYDVLRLLYKQLKEL